MNKIVVLAVVLAASSVHAAELSPITYYPDDCFLGAITDGKFIDGKTAAAKIGKKAQTYQLYAQSGRTVTSRCTAPDPDPEGVDPGRAHDFTVKCAEKKPEGIVPDPLLVGIGGTWNPLPRPVTVISGNPDVYRKAVQDFLRPRLPNSPVTLDRVIRVDLDGDGTEEVLIEAHHYVREKIPGTTGDEGPLPRRGKAGWYSVILLRKLVGTEVRTIPIAEEVYVKDAPEFGGVFDEFGIVGTFDMDGDGRFELLLSNDYYEGGYTHLIRLDGRRDKKAFWKYGTVLASCGWGA